VRASRRVVSGQGPAHKVSLPSFGRLADRTGLPDLVCSMAMAAPRFEIKKWNAVTMWSWDICADTCAICRNNLNEPSIEYQVRLVTGSGPFTRPVLQGRAPFFLP
jgi:hypothetical protein